MRYTEPIIDRTALDVANRTAKAFFNLADWERVYGNAEYLNMLVELLLSIDVTFDIVPTQTMTTIPTVAHFNTVLTNLNQIRIDAGLSGVVGLDALKADWAAGANETTPDYLDVNEWEQFTATVIYLLSSLVEYVVYCGVSQTGQARFYQHRWRQYQWVVDAPSPVRRARTNVATCGAGARQNNSYRRYT